MQGHDTEMSHEKSRREHDVPAAFSCRVPLPQDVATWERSGTTGPILSGGRIYGEARDQNLLVNSMSGQSF
ncbi:hypothetical protein GXY_15702 [Novacetimonas hansenii ATCC 23769]|uniref:Uncharacterized protein n=1 Tax=Novacetimonas hansenii ATCC 23769 TaxID=714995 RepID=D5QJ07_NOVHA|nr:hypothetical protein GXY_15702 [Novacetimonas hansenii ATCC 23769]PYD73453.1 hypothetical protein CFR74_04950 [Novacetimonas hansenii]